ncbi:Epl1 protein [Mycena kentingensis (nom. inval.)]|nr:Epl1 protein [Mycena kentingensis (nom. inval.)]
MRFAATISALLAFAAIPAVYASTVSADSWYDDGAQSIFQTSCGDGSNGLNTKYGWLTLGAIPRFPYIGAHISIAGWNSPNCGTCWQLTYKGHSIYYLAVDHPVGGFRDAIISQAAFNDLTSGEFGGGIGPVDVSAIQVFESNCGL